MGPGASGGARRLFLVLALAGAVSLRHFVDLARHHQEPAYFLMPPRFWELAAGALLFLLHRSGRLLGPWQRLPSLVPLVLLLAALYLPRRLELQATVVVVALTLAVLAMGLAARDRWLVVVLAHPWAVGRGPWVVVLFPLPLALAGAGAEPMDHRDQPGHPAPPGGADRGPGRCP